MVVFEPARPTLLAIRKLQPMLSLIGAPILNFKQPEKNRAAAIERYDLIPEDAVMYGARRLFEAAETEPWLHTAIGLMLDSMPGAESLPPSLRFGLVDLMLRDEEIHDGYDKPGFSYAVVTKAVREIRRTSESIPVRPRS